MIESPVDLVSLARAIAHAATAEQKGTGRRCRLQDSVAVQAFLVALLDGQSLHAASAAGGFSEGAVRLWVKRGNASDAPRVYASLATAVTEIAEAARMAPAPDSQPVVPDPVALAAAAAEEERRARAMAEARARQLRAGQEAEVRRLAAKLFQLMDQLGLPGRHHSVRAALDRDIAATRAQLDDLLRALAPVTETRAQRRERYLEWRRLTCRGGLTSAEFELAEDRGFREKGFAD